jgi:LppX/LprAFG-like lipoprotein
MKRAFLLLSLGGLCLSLTACGGGATTLDPVANAATKTVKVDSAKFHIDVTATGARLGSFHLSADGVTDNATQSLEMTTDLSSVAQSLGAPSGANSDAWKADLQLDGSIVYLHLPVVSMLLPNAKPWLKLDLQKVGTKAGVNVSQLLQQAWNQDPTQALQMLESVANVQKAGTEQIDGVSTTEYTGTIDLQKVAVRFPRIAKQLGSTSIPVQAWIGDDGLVRKLHLSYTEGAGSFDTTFTLFDFGAPVTVTPPPADQVTDLSNLKGH